MLISKSSCFRVCPGCDGIRIMRMALVHFIKSMVSFRLAPETSVSRVPLSRLLSLLFAQPLFLLIRAVRLSGESSLFCGSVISKLASGFVSLVLFAHATKVYLPGSGKGRCIVKLSSLMFCAV